MHGLLFYFQYVPQEHCDFTVHNFSLVWLRNCYIRFKTNEKSWFFSLVQLRDDFSSILQRPLFSLKMLCRLFQTAQNAFLSQ